MRRSTKRAVALTLTALASSACAGSGPGPAPLPPSSAAPTRPHSQADVDFMRGMIAHHGQAVVMAGWAPTHGAGRAVRVLSERIVVGQQDEIASMEYWLRQHGEAVPGGDGAGHGGMAMGHDGHGALMPGMLSPEQMTRLDQARGEDFDRLFLTYMIQHHQGALVMVEDLFGSVGAAQEDTVYKLASDVFADQEIEIERMQAMLDAMPR